MKDMTKGMRVGTKITKELMVTEEIRSEDARGWAPTSRTPSQRKRNRAILESFRNRLVEEAGASETKLVILTPIKKALGEKFYLEFENVSVIVKDYVAYHRERQEEGGKPVLEETTSLSRIEARIERLEARVKKVEDEYIE